jgi:hypothetical protein
MVRAPIRRATPTSSRRVRLFSRKTMFADGGPNATARRRQEHGQMNNNTQPQPASIALHNRTHRQGELFSLDSIVSARGPAGLAARIR